jgi:hypothetical protein
MQNPHAMSSNTMSNTMSSNTMQHSGTMGSHTMQNPSVISNCGIEQNPVTPGSTSR